DRGAGRRGTRSIRRRRRDRARARSLSALAQSALTLEATAKLRSAPPAQPIARAFASAGRCCLRAAWSGPGLRPGGRGSAGDVRVVGDPEAEAEAGGAGDTDARA